MRSRVRMHDAPGLLAMIVLSRGPMQVAAETSPVRPCASCSSGATHGLPGGDGLWKVFLCGGCAAGEASAKKLERRCIECSTMGIFKLPPLPGEPRYGGALHCSRHRVPGEVDVKHARCDGGVGCQRWAAYGDVADEVRRRCREHARPEDVYLRKKQDPMLKRTHKVCERAACLRAASWGKLGETARYCKEHAAKGDVDVRHRRCEYLGGCSKQPVFGSHDNRQRRFCAKHRRPNDCNLARGPRKDPPHANTNATQAPEP